MQEFIQYFIDFIFPPSSEELKLRTLSSDWLIHNGPQAPKTEFPFIHSLFSYKDPLIRELVWQIKYKKNKQAARCVAHALRNELLKYNEEILLIPIPISKKRRNIRGYNQSELLIDEIIKLDEKKIFKKDYGILIRARHIESQTKKNRHQRIENTKNIFEVIKKIETNKKIIIIDDVTTTGSTIKEARDALLKYGYSQIEALAIAH